MVETAADLHGSQFAVKPHRPRGVGGDLAGVLLSALTATIYKAKRHKSARVSRDTGALVATICRGGLCQSPGNTRQRKENLNQRAIKGNKGHRDSKLETNRLRK